MTASRPSALEGRPIPSLGNLKLPRYEYHLCCTWVWAASCFVSFQPMIWPFYRQYPQLRQHNSWFRACLFGTSFCSVVICRMINLGGTRKSPAPLDTTCRLASRCSRGGAIWPGSLEETIEEIDRRGGRGVALVCDHNSDQSVAQAIARVLKEQKGRIDVLVNNVFAAPARMPVNRPLWEFEDGLWDMLLSVGLQSHYIASRLVAPHMVERRRGLIVNTSSGGAVRYTFNVPFGVQKAGVNKVGARHGA